MTTLTPATSTDLAPLVVIARAYAEASKSSSTRRAYASAWARFATWCEASGLGSLPAAPSTVALYVTARADAGVRPSSLDVDLAAIGFRHHAARLPSPRSSAEVQAVRTGVRNTVGTAARAKEPLLASDLRPVVDALPATPAGIRDRALILLGFAGALRRSELVALDVADLAFSDEGLTVTIRRSKTDQEGEGRRIGIPPGRLACPVSAVRAWAEVVAKVSPEGGALFREVTRGGRVEPGRLTDRSVARIVQRSCARVGLAGDFAGHSLRRGFATSAARAGKSEAAIMRQGRWRSVVVARRYIADAGLFVENAAEGIGL